MQENENISTYPEEPTNPNDYVGFEKSVYYIFNLLRLMYYSKTESENKFYSKLGGVIGGNVTIQGNLVVNGVNYAIDTTHLNVGDYTITLAKDNEQTLTSMVGMVVPKYDGTNYGFFGWDADGYAYVGDLTNYDGTSNITLANNSSLQKIATIDTTNTVVASNGVIYVYDATSHCFKKPTVDNKYYVIRNGEFVESELFTSEEKSNISKALYHKGAFDSEDGKTRQTWEVDLGNLEWAYYADAQVWIAPYDIPSKASAVSSKYECVKIGYTEMSVGQLSTHWQFVGTTPSIIVKNGSSTELPSGILQYQLATSYTESIIENQPLLNLDSNGCNFLREEWKKGLNLLDYSKAIQNYGIDSSNGNAVSASGYYYIDNVQLKPNTTYSMAQDSAIYEYSSNMTYLGRKAGTFTTSSNATFFRFECQTSITTTPMLVEGTHSYPYQAYNGEIVHKADIEPVLLWENSSPTSDFAGQTITTKDMSKYKFIVVEYCILVGSSDNEKEINYHKFQYSTPSFGQRIFSTNGTNIMYRYFVITSSTAIQFNDATFGGNTANDRVIPLAIYGTNVL